MKNKFIKQLLSSLLAGVLFVFSCSAGALELVAEGIVNLLPADKISETLHAELEKTAVINKDKATEKTVPVVIWYTDIDYEQIERTVKKTTGLTLNNIAVDMELPPVPLIHSLEEGTKESKQEMQAYLERTKELRQQEQAQTDTYIMAKRETARNEYQKSSAKVISEVAIEESDLIFNSRYAPMVVAELTPAEIMVAAKNSRVLSIDYYVEPEIEVCTPQSDSVKANTKVNKLYSNLGLTG